MKLVVAGSRKINNRAFVKLVILKFIKRFGKPKEIISGLAPGVDRLGKSVAEELKIPVKDMPADWDRHGKPAGFIRNGEMADYGDELLLIWDGVSKGSNHMLSHMKKRGKPYHEVIIPEWVFG